MNRQNVRRYRTLLFVSLLAVLVYSFLPWNPEIFEDFNQVEHGKLVYVVGILLLIMLVFATWKLARALRISIKLRVIIIIGFFIPYLSLINAIGLLCYATVILRRTVNSDDLRSTAK